MSVPVYSPQSAATEAPALSPLKRAFIALEAAQARVAALEQAAHAPVAVIGVGCRVPGGVDDPEGFWRLMNDGVDAISRVPADRFDIEAFFDADPDVPGKIATREGGFVDRPDEFDAAFFGIAPREAQGMDPQQRLMLEVAWEALEHAGQAPDGLEGSATGVFVGVTSSDYTYLQVQAGDPTLYDAHFTSGIAHSVFSGRLSYLLGLQGPSLTVDTACSSSLVAVHLAVQSLRSSECRMALAGGVNLILAPDIFIALSHSRMLAPDGRCKTFDASADGFARGEGCGIVVLKRLDDALADGDRVLAVIRGSAVNQDGPSSGLTAPNGPAQEAVIRAALADARLAPRQVGYIEAHGTGTQLGDPLEVHAIGAVFGADRAGTPPLVIGSVKTNIGHLEGAAGVTGLIKLVLALQHRTIPAHLHFSAPSPHIHWDEFPLQVPVQAMTWAPIDGRRIGGVSSFGFSGTNVHVLLEEAPLVVRVPSVTPMRAELYTLSARDPQALAALAARHARALLARPDSELAAVCHTANHGRAHFAFRATVLARSIAELVANLQALAVGNSAPGLRTAHAAQRDPPRVALLYTGQGSQYAGMARGLYETVPAFREALDRCALGLATYLDRPMLEVLFPAEGATTPLDDTAYTQPALFAIEYALTQVWRAWGVTPNVLIGHSVGEVVAACVAGVLSLGDGLRLIATRGRLMQSLPAGGAMAAVWASEDEVARAIAPLAASVSVAAINAPGQTVISGTAAAVAAISRDFVARGVRCQPLTVSHAFHSPLVEPVLERFEREVAALALQPPNIRLVSNVTGRLASAAELTQPSYWRRHVREAVRFADGLQTLVAQQPDLLIEVGPHPTLLSFAGQVFGETGPKRIASLRKGQDDRVQLLDALASVYLAGARIDWRAQAMQPDGTVPSRVDLPTYVFQRERYWFRARPEARRVTTAGTDSGHALLGIRLRTAGSVSLFEARVSAGRPAFVCQHRVQGHVVLPATAWLDTLVACARAVLRSDAVRIDDVVLQEALLLDDDGSERVLQSVVDSAREGVHSVSLYSQPAQAETGDAWVSHAQARVVRAAVGAPGPVDLASLQQRCMQAVAPMDFYAGFKRRGLDFGSGFRAIRRLHYAPAADGQPTEALGEVELSDELAADGGGWHMHPALLDGCLQVMAAAIDAAAPGMPDAEMVLYLPIGVGSYRLLRQPGRRCWCHAVVQPGSQTRRAELRIFDSAGQVIAELQQVQLKRVSRDALSRLGERWLDDSLYEVQWREAELDTVPAWSPHALAGAAAPALHELGAAVGIEAYDGFLVRFEALCGDYTVRTLQALGWQPRAGEQLEAAELADRLGVVAAHRRQFERLLAILGEIGLLQRDAAGAGRWQVLASLPAVDPVADMARLRAACPDGAEAELDMTARVAGAMAEALRGEREPMQLLFPDGSLDTAERMYRDSPTARLYNGLMAEAMVAAAAARRAGQRLRILEIGAGTGGTTAHVLPRLQGEDIEYTFTDVGALFVARARDRFGAHRFMHFAVLDLERDPDAQGFGGREFDIVIASNVIHATADVRRTLARVRGLMAPGALLAMMEVTAPQRWFDLTVGLSSGWWAFTDVDLRPDYPTIARERWLGLLVECGFDEVAALPPPDAARGCLALQSLLLARAGAPARQRLEAWLVVADAAGQAAGLVQGLRRRGERCVVVHEGCFDVQGDEVTLDPHAPEDWRRLWARLAADGVRLGGAVHAGLLDAPADAAPSEDHRAASAAMRLAQAVLALTPSPRLWLLTRGAQAVGANAARVVSGAATLWGLGKSLRLEHPELQTVNLDLDADAAGSAGEIETLLRELDGRSHEPQVAWRGGRRRVARLAHFRWAAPAAVKDATAWRLAPVMAGSLERLQRVPLQRRVPGEGEVEIAVEVTALNFKDVLNVLGMYPGNPGPLGGECAGSVVAVGRGVTHVRVGDAVMAVASGSFASHVIARAELVQPRPAGVGAEEGAAFSIAYLTAEFCLGQLAGLRAGQRVLIHAAAGGVGQAAVRLAQRAGAEVYATAGASWKRAMLQSMGVDHVFDSRSSAFADGVMAASGGRGVDVVLNSLAGDLIEPSFAVLARGGCFVEIGKRGIKSEAWVAALGRDLRYHVVDWGETAARDPALVGALFAGLTDALRSGSLVPLPRHVFALDDAARAFRFMAQARHAGKIVVRHGAPAPFAARRDGSYLVTGGLSGLGLEVARWLSAQGAGRLVLVGRRGVTAQAEPVLAAIRSAGTEVLAEALDVSDEAGLGALLARVRVSGPPLRGVWHSAGVLDDAGVLQQDESRYERVFAPKVRAARALDALTRGDSIDAFVLFSSVAGLLGSAGQSNHAAANSFLDALAHDRAARGLPGLAINWSAWSEVGAAADRGITDRLAAQGLGAVTPAQGLMAMRRLMDAGSAQAAVLPIDWPRRLAQPDAAALLAFVSEVSGATPGTQSAVTGGAQAAEHGIDLMAQLASVPVSRRRPMVAAFVRERALRVLGVDPAKPVDPRTPLGDMGLDSLLAVELRNALGHALGQALPATLLFDYPTIDALTDHLLDTVLQLVPSRDATETDLPAAVPAASMVDAIEDLSDDEVERQLARRAQRKT